jgi:cytochrome c peroxidase
MRCASMAALAAATALTACTGPSATPLTLEIPEGIPYPVIPEDNPLTVEGVALGRRLFYDERLSGNETQACAGCHEPARAFTDARPVGIGSTGDATPRNSMALTNVAYNPVQTWANPALVTLEDQMLVPLFGERPTELGLAGRDAELIARLRADERYPAMFAAAFPAEGDPITVANVVRAIASFERTLLSFDSPFDRWYYGGDESAVTDSVRRGFDLFNTNELECFHCHGGFNFTDGVLHDGTTIPEVQFHNTGLYNIDGRGGYPEPNRGLYESTGTPSDMGRFRAPSLRNVAVTAPYMHDGSIATLDEVLDHYAAGGRTIESGPHAGVGSESPLKNIFLHGFTLTAEQRADVLAFLESLTDETFLTDPALGPPD